MSDIDIAVHLLSVVLCVVYDIVYQILNIFFTDLIKAKVPVSFSYRMQKMNFFYHNI